MTPWRRIALLSDDTELAGWIGAAAAALEIPFDRFPEIDPEAVRQAGCVFLDLDAGEERVAAALRALRSGAGPGIHLCCCGSRVDLPILQMMMEAGADRVLSRSALSRTAESVLREVFMGAC